MGYYARRVGRAVVTLWALATLTFAMIRLLPNGLLHVMRERIATNYPTLTDHQVHERLSEQAEAMNLYLDASLAEQYVRYLASVGRGDLGTSFLYGEPVAAVVGDGLPWTVFYVTLATVLVFVVALAWGMAVAYRDHWILDGISNTAAAALSSLPSYVYAIPLLFVFGYELEWLPKTGRTAVLITVGPSLEFVVQAVSHAILPVTALALAHVGIVAVGVRKYAGQVLPADHVRAARLRGVAERRIAGRYVARHAVPPMTTVFMTFVSFVLGMSVVIEQLFSYRGLGWYMVRGFEKTDYPLLVGTFLVYAVALAMAWLASDLAAHALDVHSETAGSQDGRPTDSPGTAVYRRMRLRLTAD